MLRKGTKKNSIKNRKRSVQAGKKRKAKKVFKG